MADENKGAARDQTNQAGGGAIYEHAKKIRLVTDQATVKFTVNAGGTHGGSGGKIPR